MSEENEPYKRLLKTQKRQLEWAVNLTNISDTTKEEFRKTLSQLITKKDDNKSNDENLPELPVSNCK